MSETNYPEEFRALDSAVSRSAKMLRCLDPHIRRMIAATDEEELSYDEILLVLKDHYRNADGERKAVYEFSMRIHQNKED